MSKKTAWTGPGVRGLGSRGGQVDRGARGEAAELLAEFLPAPVSTRSMTMRPMSLSRPSWMAKARSGRTSRA